MEGGLGFEGHFSMSNTEHVPFILESMCTALCWFQGAEGLKFTVMLKSCLFQVSTLIRCSQLSCLFLPTLFKHK